MKLILLLLLLIIMTAGCGKKAPIVEGTAVYYLNKDATSVVPVEYEITGDAPEIKVEELLAKLEETPESMELRSVLPESIKLLNYTLERQQLYLDFDTEYLNMDRATEVLVRAALVKTMVQIEEVSFVGIRIAGEPLKDSKGIGIGLMNENSFLDNMGSANLHPRVSLLQSDISRRILVCKSRDDYRHRQPIHEKCQPR